MLQYGMLYNFKVITLSGAAGGGKWGQAPRGAGLGGASNTLFRHLKNEFFSRNLGQNMSKMRIF